MTDPRDQKLARIDRELAALAARQAELLAERARIHDDATLARAPRRPQRPPQPTIPPVTELAQHAAQKALQALRGGRRVRV